VALPAKEQALAATGALVRAATAERERLRLVVAGEAAIEFLKTDFAKAAQASLNAQAVVDGMLQELQQIGIVSGSPEAYGAMERVRNAFAAVKAEIVAAADTGRAKRLLARLNTDADATL
jgi:hypothetical protein